MGTPGSFQATFTASTVGGTTVKVSVGGGLAQAVDVTVKAGNVDAIKSSITCDDAGSAGSPVKCTIAAKGGSGAVAGGAEDSAGFKVSTQGGLVVAAVNFLDTGIFVATFVSTVPGTLTVEAKYAGNTVGMVAPTVVLTSHGSVDTTKSSATCTSTASDESTTYCKVYTRDKYGNAMSTSDWKNQAVALEGSYTKGTSDDRKTDCTTTALTADGEFSVTCPAACAPDACPVSMYLSVMFQNDAIVTNEEVTVTANTGPAFNVGFPAVVTADTAETTATIRVAQDFAGKVFVVCVPTAGNTGLSAPTPAQVKAGTNSADVASAAVSGVAKEVALAANTEGVLSLTSLTALTSYQCYFVGEATSGSKLGEATTGPLTVTTLDLTKPSFAVFTAAYAEGAITVDFKLNEAGTVYVAVAQAATMANPTPAALRANEPSTQFVHKTVAVQAGKAATVIVQAPTLGVQYTIYGVAEDDATNLQTSIRAVTIETEDRTGPSMTIGASGHSTDATKAQIAASLDEPGKLYWVLAPENQAGVPSFSEVKAGKLVGGASPLLGNAGDITFSAASTTITVQLSGLSEATRYAVFVAAEDDKANASPVGRYVFMTRDVSTAAFTGGYPAVSKVLETSCQFDLNTAEAATVYFVVDHHPQSTGAGVGVAGAGTPSKDQILAGVLANGNAAVAKGTAVVGSANKDVAVAISGLRARGYYRIYAVTRDASNNVLATAAWADVRTQDLTRPLVSSSGNNPSVVDFKSSTATLNVWPSEPGMVYYRVVQTSQAIATPTPLELRASRTGEFSVFTAGSKVTRTISSLSEQTQYTLYVTCSDLHVAGRDASVFNMAAMVRVVTFTTPDLTPPTVSAGTIRAEAVTSGSANTKETTVKVFARASEAATLYVLVRASNEAAPSVVDVKNGGRVMSYTARSSDEEVFVTIGGLVSKISYVAYVVARDTVGFTTAAVQASSVFTQPDFTPPSFAGGYPQIIDTTQQGGTLRVSVLDEMPFTASTIHWVLLDYLAPRTPTAAMLKTPTDAALWSSAAGAGGGWTRLPVIHGTTTSGSSASSSPVDIKLSHASLEPNTAYRIYVSLTDADANNANTRVEGPTTLLTARDMTTLPPTLTSPSSSGLEGAVKTAGDKFDVSFFLPEDGKLGSVKVTFVPTVGAEALSKTTPVAYLPTAPGASRVAAGAHTMPMSVSSIPLYTGTYSVVLSYADVEGNTPATATFTGFIVDVTPPVFSGGYPKVEAGSTTLSGATVAVQLDEAATVYWMALPAAATAPTPGAVRAGKQDGTGQSPIYNLETNVVAAGIVSMTTAGGVASQGIAGGTITLTSLLLTGVHFKVYMLAQDAAGNYPKDAAVATSVDITTLGDTKKPEFINGTPTLVASTTVGGEALLSFAASEPVFRAWFLAVPGSAAAVPSLAAIMSEGTQIITADAAAATTFSSTVSLVAASKIAEVRELTVFVALADRAVPRNVKITYGTVIVLPDLTGPTATATSIVFSPREGGTAAVLEVVYSEKVYGHYVILPKTVAPPSAAQIKTLSSTTTTSGTISGALASASSPVERHTVQMNGDDHPPSSSSPSLASLKGGTDYVLYAVGTDTVGNFGPVSTTAFQAPPAAAPAMTAAVLELSGKTGLRMKTSVSRAGSTVYWTLVPGNLAASIGLTTGAATPPSFAQILAGQNSMGGAAFKSGSAQLDVTRTAVEIAITGALERHLDYTAYLVTVDATNMGSMVMGPLAVNLESLDRTAPAFLAGFPVVEPTNQTLHIKVSKAGTVHIIVVPADTLADAGAGGAEVPSPLQIRAGIDGAGAFAAFATSVAVDTDALAAVAFATDLAPNTAYVLFVATQSRQGDLAEKAVRFNYTTNSGITRPPTLLLPRADGPPLGASLPISFTLPEKAKAGSVFITFTKVLEATKEARSVSITTLTLAPHLESRGTFTFWVLTSNLTARVDGQDGGNQAVRDAVGALALQDGASYTMTLSFQDLLGNPAATATVSSPINIDRTPPSFIIVPATGYNGKPKVVSVGERHALVSMATSELPVDVFWVALRRREGAPDADGIVAGRDGSGMNTAWSGSLRWTTNVEGTTGLLRGLPASTDLDIVFALRDTAFNVMGDFTTTTTTGGNAGNSADGTASVSVSKKMSRLAIRTAVDTTPPVADDLRIAEVTSSQITLHVSLDEPGRVSWLLKARPQPQLEDPTADANNATTDGTAAAADVVDTTAMTPAGVRSGMGGNSLSSSSLFGAFDVDRGGVSVARVVSGLQANTRYTLYVTVDPATESTVATTVRDDTVANVITRTTKTLVKGSAGDVDSRAPVFILGFPKVVGIVSTNHVSLAVKMSDKGQVLWAVLPAEAEAPTSATVVAMAGASNSNAGVIVVPGAQMEVAIQVGGLIHGRRYIAYMVAEDAVMNRGAIPASVTFQTATPAKGSPPPVYTVVQSLSLGGYTKATFGEKEQVAVATSIAAYVGVDVTAVEIMGVKDAPPQRRRTLLANGNGGVVVDYKVVTRDVSVVTTVSSQLEALGQEVATVAASGGRPGLAVSSFLALLSGNGLSKQTTITAMSAATLSVTTADESTSLQAKDTPVDKGEGSESQNIIAVVVGFVIVAAALVMGMTARRKCILKRQQQAEAHLQAERFEPAGAPKKQTKGGTSEGGCEGKRATGSSRNAWAAAGAGEARGAGDERMGREATGLEFNVVLPTRGKLGMGVTHRDTHATHGKLGCKVTRCVDGGNAATSGKILANDWIIAVNGTNVRHGDLKGVLKMLKGAMASGDTVTVRFRREVERELQQQNPEAGSELVVMQQQNPEAGSELVVMGVTLETDLVGARVNERSVSISSVTSNPLFGPNSRNMLGSSTQLVPLGRAADYEHKFGDDSSVADDGTITVSGEVEDRGADESGSSEASIYITFDAFDPNAVSPVDGAEDSVDGTLLSEDDESSISVGLEQRSSTQRQVVDAREPQEPNLAERNTAFFQTQREPREGATTSGNTRSLPRPPTSRPPAFAFESATTSGNESKIASAGGNGSTFAFEIDTNATGALGTMLRDTMSQVEGASIEAGVDAETATAVIALDESDEEIFIDPASAGTYAVAASLPGYREAALERMRVALDDSSDEEILFI